MKKVNQKTVPWNFSLIISLEKSKFDQKNVPWKFSLEKKKHKKVLHFIPKNVISENVLQLAIDIFPSKFCQKIVTWNVLHVKPPSK